jgi:hypothetical protein
MTAYLFIDIWVVAMTATAILLIVHMRRALNQRRRPPAGAETGQGHAKHGELR